MKYLLNFFVNLLVRRWRILLLIITFITLPLLLIQYAMLKEQSIDSSNWFIFDDRHILNEKLVDGKSSNDPHRKITDRLRRPSEYCNLPLAKFYEDEKALGKYWRLKKVFLFIRHGQRSSSDPMLKSNFQYYINCSLKQFPLFKRPDWKTFIETVNKSYSHVTTFLNHERCNENQMTLFGILQMFIMGSKLKKAYEDFLDFNSVRIFSTTYQRSILSGEIIRHLLVKDTLGSQSSEIEESQSLIFCRPSAEVPCQCPSLRYYYAKYNRHLNLLTSRNTKCIQLVNYFNSILVRNGTEEQSHLLSLSSLFDIVSSALCANNLEEIGKANMFCYPLKGDTISQDHWEFLYKNDYVDEKYSSNANNSDRRFVKFSNRCISLQLIISLWQCFDERTFVVNGNPDYRKYAKLAAYPILKEIINNGKEINLKKSDNEERSNFVIYIGHDHSLSLLLGSLNFKEIIDKNVRKALNTWPGFASRITIELYESINKSSNGISRQNFRLLYNGLDITSALKFCEAGQGGCDFQLLVDYISGTGFWDKDLFVSSSYSRECKLV